MNQSKVEEQGEDTSVFKGNFHPKIVAIWSGRGPISGHDFTKIVAHQSEEIICHDFTTNEPRSRRDRATIVVWLNRDRVDFFNEACQPSNLARSWSTTRSTLFVNEGPPMKIERSSCVRDRVPWFRAFRSFDEYQTIAMCPRASTVRGRSDFIVAVWSRSCCILFDEDRALLVTPRVVR